MATLSVPDMGNEYLIELNRYANGMTRTSFWSGPGHMEAFLSGENGKISELVAMAFFTSQEKALQVKATGISAREYAGVLVLTKNPQRAVEHVLTQNVKPVIPETKSVRGQPCTLCGKTKDGEEINDKNKQQEQKLEWEKRFTVLEQQVVQLNDKLDYLKQKVDRLARFG